MMMVVLLLEVGMVEVVVAVVVGATAAADDITYVTIQSCDDEARIIVTTITTFIAIPLAFKTIVISESWSSFKQRQQ